MLNFVVAIVFYTRLPLFRTVSIPDNYFKNIVYCWPIAGWLTASVMAAVLYFSTMLFPVSVAVVLAMISRVLLTGALHEDGLADFCDGFGAGTSKERILAIMKDSHIGCYGVLGLILYALLLYTLLSSLPIALACFAILAADPFCKGLSSMITLRLNYARTADASKLKVVYNQINTKFFIIVMVFGLIPFLAVFSLISPIFYLSAVLPIILFFLLTGFMKSKIQGYTGDCAGALYLLLELSFYLSFVALAGFV